MWCWWWWWFSDTIFSPKTFACRTCQSIFDSWVHLAATMRTTGDLMANPAWPTLHGKRLRLAQEWCSGNDVNRKVLPLKPCMKLVGWLYTQCLHTEAPWHIFSSTHSTLLCTENLITHRKLLHKRFYKTTFYTWMLLYTKALTNKNLSHTHTNAFAHKRFDTQKLLRTRTDTEQTFTHTQMLLHRKLLHT